MEFHILVTEMRKAPESTLKNREESLQLWQVLKASYICLSGCQIRWSYSWSTM